MLKIILFLILIEQYTFIFVLITILINTNSSLFFYRTYKYYKKEYMFWIEIDPEDHIIE